jgi:hypothetical protein
MNGRLLESCIHAANVFYLLSFLTLDMLWLRALTCFGLTLGLIYFTCQPAPLYSCSVWQAAFLAINVIQIRRLIGERRQLRLSAEQARLAQVAFQDLSREELLALLARTSCLGRADQGDFSSICRGPLTDEERALRDIAFSRLSRTELLNLLTRRMWNSLRRRNPTTWWRRRREEEASAAAKNELRLGLPHTSRSSEPAAPAKIDH